MKTMIFLFFSILFINNLYSQASFWGEQNSNTYENLRSISAVSNYNTDCCVWACGTGCTVIKSSDDGEHWYNASGTIPTSVTLVNIWAIDYTTAVVAGYFDTDTWVWKTTNGGSVWIPVFYQSDGFINFVAFKNNNPNQGILVGDPVGGRWSIWRTTNAGNTWDSVGRYLPQAGTESGYINSFSYVDSRIWFGTNNTRLYYSTNDGVNWVSQSTAPEVNSYTVFFMDIFGPDGLVGGSTLMRTSNFGTNWTTITSMGSGNFRGFAGLPIGIDNNLFLMQTWYVRTNNNIYKSLGWGENWEIEYTAPAGNYNHITKDRTGMHIWGVRDAGGITRCTCFVVGIQQLSNEIPSNYYISQNFPNPFNPVTHFDIDVKEQGNVKLNIYNQLGQLVAILVDKKLSTGTYRITWDAGSYSSGVYFYTLVANDYVITKKMLLVK
ncbi:MAG: T9SS C-terminal target domain-containing protein [Ignavibacteriae bacterium]|nr:MAG: T9SS C-terminal target domain-containing protein [Ignavibacteriota bacterium]